MRSTLLAPALACLLAAGCASAGSAGSTGSAGAAGWRQLELRDYDGALGLFERALQSSQAAELHAGRARALFLLGRLDEARDSYQLALARDAHDPQWHIGLGLVELARGEVFAAVAACDAAIELDPRSAKAFYNRGCAHLRALAHDSAVADFTQAIRLAPDRAEAYNSRGVALVRTGRMEAALEDFQRATLLAPLGSAHGNRAVAFYSLGRTQQALTELNAAIRLERTNAAHYTNRGRIYVDLDRPDLALLDFEQALALAPGSADLPRLLADARACARVQAADEPPPHAARAAAYAD